MGREVRRIRTEAQAQSGLREIYSTLDMPGKNSLKDAHAALDKAVLNAYGFSSKTDILQQLLDLNESIRLNIESAESVTGPGIPLSYKFPARLVTADCIGI